MKGNGPELCSLLGESASTHFSFLSKCPIYRQYYICSQEQWDIHKLDPYYDCYIPTPPQVPVILSVFQPDSISSSRKRRVPDFSSTLSARAPPHKFRKTDGPKAKHGSKKRTKKNSVPPEDDTPSVPAAWFAEPAPYASNPPNAAPFFSPSLSQTGPVPPSATSTDHHTAPSDTVVRLDDYVVQSGEKTSFPPNAPGAHSEPVSSPPHAAPFFSPYLSQMGPPSATSTDHQTAPPETAVRFDDYIVQSGAKTSYPPNAPGADPEPASSPPNAAPIFSPYLSQMGPVPPSATSTDHHTAPPDTDVRLDDHVVQSGEKTSYSPNAPGAPFNTAGPTANHPTPPADVTNTEPDQAASPETPRIDPATPFVGATDPQPDDCKRTTPIRLTGRPTDTRAAPLAEPHQHSNPAPSVANAGIDPAGHSSSFGTGDHSGRPAASVDTLGIGSHPSAAPSVHATKGDVSMDVDEEMPAASTGSPEGINSTPGTSMGAVPDNVSPQPSVNTPGCPPAQPSVNATGFIAHSFPPPSFVNADAGTSNFPVPPFVNADAGTSSFPAPPFISADPTAAESTNMEVDEQSLPSFTTGPGPSTCPDGAVPTTEPPPCASDAGTSPSNAHSTPATAQETSSTNGQTYDIPPTFPFGFYVPFQEPEIIDLTMEDDFAEPRYIHTREREEDMDGYPNKRRRMEPHPRPRPRPQAPEDDEAKKTKYARLEKLARDIWKTIFKQTRSQMADTAGG